ncbi:MAG TPA: hypothetical protein VHV53_09445 [Solirubrobacterales bacterium]|jgi:hypothetical protein|nr:hypothetical protein [Solirubrobacterales bacterium]
MRRLIVASVFAMALVLASAAFAAEVSRDEYKAAAEPICKTNTQANERILAGVRQEVQKGNLKPAAAKFMKASTALKEALKELEALPQPVADQARLARWFSLVGLEAELFASAGKKLKAGDKAGAEHIVTKLTQNANKANNQVLPFGFRYCRLEPSKFT